MISRVCLFLTRKMTFSKSYGYAIRGTLYIAMMNTRNEKIGLNEIAAKLSIPKHFLAKIMKRVVKAGILSSVKGPSGGFYVNKNTNSTTLLTLLEITDGLEEFDVCMLQLRKCNNSNPCPLHNRFQSHKTGMLQLLKSTTVGDLLKHNDKPLSIKGLVAG